MSREGRAGVGPERLGLDVTGTRIQRQRLGLMQTGLEPQSRYSERARLRFEVRQHRARDAATAGRRRDIHPLQLSDIRGDEPHPSARDRLIGVPPDDENALWWGEFGDRQLAHVTSAVTHDVLLLHGLDEVERHRCVERRWSEFDHERHRQPWSTGPMPLPSANPPAMAPVT